ncbi:MAG: orotate phosphoribosyltransferase [Schleiferiaceae bacterium]|nr:orotate phosphoribosyltransferase [Schleiferiaceae bacterium]
MVNESETAKRLAELLLQIKAIELRPEKPFTWASGILSPIYCDNRVILSHPTVRTYVREEMAQSIRTHYPTVEVIAGVATGAIALAALVAQELNLPMVYVRASAKGHGRQNLIEGQLAKNARVVVIEDLVSTGMSSLQAVDSLRQSGANILGMGAIFTYGFQNALDAFSQKDCPLFTLSDYAHLLQVAERRNTLNAEEAIALSQWRQEPENWGK